MASCPCGGIKAPGPWGVHGALDGALTLQSGWRRANEVITSVVSDAVTVHTE